MIAAVHAPRRQQLAGVVMWAPGSVAYLLAALWIGARWLRPRIA